jgi:hypothetical protein
MFKIVSTADATTLPDDIKVPDGVRFAHELITTNQGIAKFRPDDEHPNPVTLVLEQPLGHDKTLFEFFGKKAGFDLKLTISLPTDDGNGGIEQKDILDIDLKDLVPESIVFGQVVTLTALTLTPPTTTWICKPPPRRRRAGKKGN